MWHIKISIYDYAIEHSFLAGKREKMVNLVVIFGLRFTADVEQEKFGLISASG